MRRHLPSVVSLVLAASCASAPALGQHGPTHDSAAVRSVVEWRVGAQAIGLVTRADPAFGGRALTEGYLTQPALMAHVALPRLRATFTGTLNLEGVTLERGELNAGVYGEGYVDRRHPHTLVHEAIARVGGRVGRRAAWSLGIGKGFAPFGSDDPMTRPLVKFPANHHLSHVLERLLAVAAVRGAVGALELGTFNGDEPTGPYAWPSARRFGDSWSARATTWPARGLELSASVAEIASPEHRGGQGLDQRKTHAAVRLVRGEPAAPRLYLLLEAARTDDRTRGRRVFRYESALAEGAARRGAWTLAARLERTTRPEEDRLVDPFRVPRPHVEGSIIGLTRWDVATVAVTRDHLVRGGRLRIAPVVEAALAHATDRVRPSGFESRSFYGASSQWSLSAGVRVGAGMRHARMGRYGPSAHDAH